jgi:hypothetical protein
MSHQDGLGNNGPESTGLDEPDDGDDRMQKERENVAHVRMVSNGKKLECKVLAEFAYDRSCWVNNGHFESA